MKETFIPWLRDYSHSLLGFIRYLRANSPCIPGDDHGATIDKEDEEMRR